MEALDVLNVTQAKWETLIKEVVIDLEHDRRCLAIQKMREATTAITCLGPALEGMVSRNDLKKLESLSNQANYALVCEDTILIKKLCAIKGPNSGVKLLNRITAKLKGRRRSPRKKKLPEQLVQTCC